ncbi:MULTISPECIES: tRNA (adenosine(37)-N6)-threonylcarbamoyltransferase complex dimerization subunit type 1 TsaB [Tsukamurella]|uniref:tRNA (Adenosine(37)-N6)-threonylcarbamoyltransferase complex dimerization subunit type 1 TsaB n=2 Tax=Tsukamurella TaxID=2060 RepID=A0A5C5S7M7_9ACTN|nr:MULTISPECIES: tRNA (adenosine(37)-N6)-threonylcarbamoyltransferase complex dimerization subunit type 1 TsaB [Tsukamurella]NMD57850.1 tRNA (adenosine(37)-N6)-threonylcarbamoyltransferase complex dimerization subunit type 1 TsaB [Tsukamurella columbiensis]TWS30892.1 tRNA (adenosine(37)-N6)-threonylcarbamoyltransferase complex dimerization subunit type 1 TsaB [Tsukamurella conjunctivitidis]
MYVLALDTATPALTVGIVDSETGAVLARRDRTHARGHAEVLVPYLLECLAEAGLRREDLGAVIVGCGPGPFTGLRVGMATGAAFGDALGIEVHGVCSLDAIAHGEAGDVVVVTDARRKEVYWARYSDGVRTDGPGVIKPAELDTAGARVVEGSPTPSSLVAVGKRLLGTAPQPLVPLYLRRPDAVEMAARA